MVNYRFSVEVILQYYVRHRVAELHFIIIIPIGVISLYFTALLFMCNTEVAYSCSLPQAIIIFYHPLFHEGQL